MHAHALSRFGLRFSRALLLLALICFSFASARAAAAAAEIAAAKAIFKNARRARRRAPGSAGADVAGLSN